MNKPKFKLKQLVYIFYDGLIQESTICGITEYTNKDTIYHIGVHHSLTGDHDIGFKEKNIFLSEKDCVKNLIKNSREYYYKRDDSSPDHETYTISKNL